MKSEKQRIIWEEVQNLRPMEDEHAVPGVPTKTIEPNNDTIRMCSFIDRQQISLMVFCLCSMLFSVGLLRSLRFLVSIFPLHDKEDIKLIERDWFMSKDSLFKSQDIRKHE